MLWFNASTSNYTQLGACTEEQRFQCTCRNTSVFCFRNAPNLEWHKWAILGFSPSLFTATLFCPVLVFLFLTRVVPSESRSLDVSWGTSGGRKLVKFVYFYYWTLALVRHVGIAKNSATALNINTAYFSGTPSPRHMQNIGLLNKWIKL